MDKWACLIVVSPRAVTGALAELPTELEARASTSTIGIAATGIIVSKLRYRIAGGNDPVRPGDKSTEHLLFQSLTSLLDRSDFNLALKPIAYRLCALLHAVLTPLSGGCLIETALCTML